METGSMKKLIGIPLLAFAATSAYAADDCTAQATEKKLAGAAKTSFMKKCEADIKAADPANASCEATAGEKKLAGAAKNSFMKKCVSDAKGTQENAACANSAKEKKLAGAAKTSFMKKCEADAKAAPAK
jgi:hypothetical protein